MKFIIYNFAKKELMNANLLFFCTMCRDKSPKEIEEISCEIDHNVKYYKRGDIIASQGDRISHLYILTKGQVKTEIVSKSGLTVSVEEIKAPYPLAAAFIFADNNRFPVEVTAMEDSEVILISKSVIEKQMALCPGFLRGFMAFTANRVQFLSERLKIFSQKSIKAKIAYYILQHDKNGTFELGRSIASLSEYFGVERPSLSRAISEMARDGIIEFKAGKGKILKYNDLKELL
ncbi:CRP-like cAMP-binding protein [Dysgonomonadaceae bacterium PH5-43]|nr:CRP-like cAMP-binding protein [Dysgonomonadaceae bacterium PH5-43]